MNGAWDKWLGNVIEVLRAPLACVENCLFRLMSWGMDFVDDLGIPNFLSELRHALDLLELEVWLSILHDSTSLRVVLFRFCEELLRRGYACGSSGSRAAPPPG